MPDMIQKNQLVYALVMNNGAEFNEDWRTYTTGVYSSFGDAIDHAITSIRTDPDFKFCKSFNILLFNLDGAKIETYECETHKRGDSFVVSFYFQGNVRWHIPGEED